MLMADKVSRIRRIAAVAIGAVRTIFRTGQAWGTTRTRAKTARRARPTGSTAPGVAAGVAAGAAGAYFLDPQNGKRRRHAALARTRALLGRGGSEGQPKAG